VSIAGTSTTSRSMAVPPANARRFSGNRAPNDASASTNRYKLRERARPNANGRRVGCLRVWLVVRVVAWRVCRACANEGERRTVRGYAGMAGGAGRRVAAVMKRGS